MCLQQLRGKLERDEFDKLSANKEIHYTVSMALVLHTLNFTLCMYNVRISTPPHIIYHQIAINFDNPIFL